MLRRLEFLSRFISVSRGKVLWSKMALECSKTIIHDLGRRSQAPYSVYRFNHDHNDSQILAAQKLIEKNYSQAIDLSNVASSCAMSRRTFERRFKVAVGITPLLYMQRIRIEAAKSLLENTNHTFEEISFQVGYDNSSFFRKLFNKHTGLGPKEYQKKFQWLILVQPMVQEENRIYPEIGYKAW